MGKMKTTCTSRPLLHHHAPREPGLLPRGRQVGEDPGGKSRAQGEGLASSPRSRGRRRRGRQLCHRRVRVSPNDRPRSSHQPHLHRRRGEGVVNHRDRPRRGRIDDAGASSSRGAASLSSSGPSSPPEALPLAGRGDRRESDLEVHVSLALRRGALR